jgi:ankyrin repeat protein
MAVMCGFDGRVIKRLVESGADPNAATKPNELTPLHAAVMVGNLSAVEALHALDADSEAVRAILPLGGPGMQITSGGTTPLMFAVVIGDAEMVRLLLKKGAKLEATNHTLDRAVHFAAWGGHSGILRPLLEQGAGVDPMDRWLSTPLHYAALLGRSEAIKLLLEAGADMEAMDEAGFTPLLNAAEHDQLETVKYLLEQGASRRAKTSFGKGPLRVAATTNALQVAQYLIELGENVDGEPSDAMRPLHEATSSGHPQMVELLLQHGASTELRDRAMDSTPLCMAVRSRPESAKQWVRSKPFQSSYTLNRGSGAAYLDIIRLLAAQGADLNAADRSRNTALHYAVEYGDREVVELLLSLGARGDLVNGRGMTPHEIAFLNGHREIAALLQPEAPPAP